MLHNRRSKWNFSSGIGWLDYSSGVGWLDPTFFLDVTGEPLRQCFLTLGLGLGPGLSLGPGFRFGFRISLLGEIAPLAPLLDSLPLSIVFVFLRSLSRVLFGVAIDALANNMCN